MNILVTGGTGALGRHIVETVAAKPDVTVRLLTSSPPTSNPPHTSWVHGDLATGDGLADAVQGIDTILHAASDYIVDPQKVDVEGTRLLLGHARAAGVSHIAFISIVGIERIPLPYYRAKVQAEQIVRESGIPWSILRATQFHTLVDSLLKQFEKPFLVGFLPAELKFQPVEASEVAARLVAIALKRPTGYAREFGGPEVLTFGSLARIWFELRGISPAVLPIRFSEDFNPHDDLGFIPQISTWQLADAYRRGYNTCAGEYTPGHLTWSEWVKRTYPK